MTKQQSLQWLRELLWLIATAIIAVMVLYPLYGTIEISYLKTNLLLVVLSVTYFRYILFLNEVPYLTNLYTRILLIVVAAISFWQFMRVLQNFHFLQENYIISTFLTPQKALESGDAIQKSFAYFKQEYMLFNLAVLVLTIALVFRTISSLWRLSKKM